MKETKKKASTAIRKPPTKVVAKTVATKVKPEAQVPKQVDVAITTPIPPRFEITIDKPVVHLVNSAGLDAILQQLGTRKCMISLYMRGKCHGMRKYHPDTKELNPYHEAVVKYSLRNGWINIPYKESLDRANEKAGLPEREVGENKIFTKDKVGITGTFIADGARGMCLRPTEAIGLTVTYMDLNGKEISADELRPYYEHRDSIYKAMKFPNVIEIRGGYWAKKRGSGERYWARFHYRNADNLTTLDAAMCDRLPDVVEQPDDYTNEEPA